MLDNKICIVTGGASGLGLEIVQLLIEEKANVIAVDINKQALKSLDVNYRGKPLRTFCIDIADPSEVEVMYGEIIKLYGTVDILVNNAGIDFTKPIREMEIKEFAKVVGVNLNGAFIMSKFAWPHMEKQRGGHIINVASTASKRAWPNASAYHASKWGLVGLSHALLTEGKNLGIKVSAVILGGMRTPFILDRFPDTPLSVLQDPKNAAEAILYILKLKKDINIPELMITPLLETSWP